MLEYENIFEHSSNHCLVEAVGWLKVMNATCKKKKQRFLELEIFCSNIEEEKLRPY